MAKINWGTTAQVLGGAVPATVKKIKGIMNKPKSGGNSSSDGSDMEAPPSMHKGGKVKKTRTYLLKKGERVLTKKQQKQYSGKKR